MKLAIRDDHNLYILPGTDRDLKAVRAGLAKASVFISPIILMNYSEPIEGIIELSDPNGGYKQDYNKNYFNIKQI